MLFGSLSQGKKADEKLHWAGSHKVLMSLCSERNHRAFSQHLDQIVVKSSLCGLCGEQGCQGAVVKLSPE